jgi:putative PEP-CTERM system TPR-repeat lipoprotein
VAIYLTRAFLTSAALLIVLAGCGGVDEQALLKSAKARLSERKTTAAIIDLNTVLQKQPNLAEARFLLGTAFMDLSDPKSAALEFQKARAAGASDDLVVPELARAWLLDGQFKKLIEGFGATKLQSALANASLQASIAGSYARLGQPDKAELSVTQALTFVPNHPEALLVRSRLLAQRGQADEAIKALDDLVKDKAARLRALQLRGDILYGLKRNESAAQSDYRQIIVDDPKNLSAHVSLISLELNAGRVEAAASLLAQFKKELPGHPQVAYTEAQVALAGKDIARARALAVALLGKYDQTAPLLMLAGTAYLRGNELTLAEGVLTKAVNQAPDAVSARFLLAQTLARLGQLEKALKTLEPLLAQASPPTEILSLAGELEVSRGNFTAGDALLARAMRARPGDVAIETAQAAARLARGEVVPAMERLSQIAGRDTGITADMALVGSHMQRGEFDKALAVIDQIERKRPNEPGSFDLRGRVQLLRRDYAAARMSFEKALALNPAYYPASVSLATLDMMEKKYEVARARFEAALKADPKNSGARLAAIAMSATMRAPKDQLEQQLRAAIAADPSHVATRLALIGHFRPIGDIKPRLEAAQAANAAIPNDPLLLEQLARAQADSGDAQQAIRTFNNVLSLRPKTLSVYLAMANLRLVGGDTTGAVAAVLRGVEVLPESPELRAQLVQLLKRVPDPSAPLSAAAAIQRRQPDSAAGYILEGDILAEQKKWQGAIQAYRKALTAAKPDRASPAKLYGAIWGSGDRAGAETFASGRLKSHPNDSDFRVFLGTSALLAGDTAKADRMFSEAVRINPSHPQALNNLAWIRADRKGSDAVALAERAVALQPGQAAFLDTLAKALAVDGRSDDAIKVLRAAVDASNDMPALRLSLVRLYAKSGKREDALREVEALQALGSKFAGQDELIKLRKQLGL